MKDVNQPKPKHARVIAFSHYSVKNDIGGVTSWLERLLLRLHRDGIPIVVLLHHLGTDVEDSSLLQTLLRAGITVEIEPRPNFTEDGVRSTLNFLNRHQPKVFLPQCLESMFYAASIAGQVGLPWSLSIRSDDPFYWAIAETIPPENYGGVMVGVSQYICYLAQQKQLASHSYAIASGTPLFSSRASFSDRPFRVVYSGRVIEEQKRFSLILETMIQSCRLDSRIECWILGDGPALQASQKKIQKLKLEDRIRFFGRLSLAEVESALSKCQAILLMSDYEGVPVALMEAMAMGVVPVARSIPSGIPELLQEEKTGLLVDDNPETAARAIVSLANRPKLWQQCSEASKKLIEDTYSEDVCYEKWLKVIQKLGERSSINYPIRIPKHISLPPVHPQLEKRDCRQPSFKQKMNLQVNRIKNRLIKKLALLRCNDQQLKMK